MNTAQLISEARQAQSKAYAPYSNFQVGAALLTASGKIYQGANIENSSFGLTVCAERNAVFKAVYDGERDLAAIAVCSSGSGYVYPCGACLQVLAEFSPQIRVIISNENDDFREYELKELLPQIFSL
ncbi:MAG: cytidine deaminase [Syntrophomonadaceae bacterium]|nr:cytidine deaminase [Syntrophomonadaceae bacterium]